MEINIVAVEDFYYRYSTLCLKILFYRIALTVALIIIIGNSRNMIVLAS